MLLVVSLGEKVFKWCTHRKLSEAPHQPLLQKHNEIDSDEVAYVKRQRLWGKVGDHWGGLDVGAEELKYAR